MSSSKLKHCPVCDNNDTDKKVIIEDEQHYTRIHCICCNCAYINTKSSVSLKYGIEYNQEFVKQREIHKAQVMSGKLICLVGKKSMKSTILEVGPGNGWTTFYLMAAGLNVEAVELNYEQAKLIRNFTGVQCYHGGFEGMSNRNKYDFIYSSHLIEHYENPYIFLRKARSLLKDGGVIYIDTPDLDCSKGCNQNWHHFRTRHPLEHLCILSDTALGLAAHKTGLLVGQFERFDAYGSFQATLHKDRGV